MLHILTVQFKRNTHDIRSVLTLSGNDICVDLSVHKRHKTSADIKSKAAAFLLLNVCSSVKTFEDICKLVLCQSAASILDIDPKVTAFFIYIYLLVFFVGKGTNFIGISKMF